MPCLLEKSMEDDQLFLCDNNNLNVRKDEMLKFFIEDKLHLNQEGFRILPGGMRNQICGVLEIQMINRGRFMSPKNRRNRFKNNNNYNNRRGKLSRL